MIEPATAIEPTTGVSNWRTNLARHAPFSGLRHASFMFALGMKENVYYYHSRHTFLCVVIT